MQLGPYELTPINDGIFALDGGAMFGTVPRVLWEKRHPADAKNRITMALRTLLIRGEGRVILVDTGIGDKFEEKYASIYRIERKGQGLLDRLADLDLQREQITDVVISHLHFDHAGGATRRDSSGNLVPTFPGARYHVQRSNLDAACCPNRREQASYLAENRAPLEEANVLEMHDGRAEIAPGVELLPSDGHTRGMQMVRIFVEGVGSVLYPADLIPTASHLRIPWVMGYDLFPLTVMQEKETILQRAVAESWILVFEHDAELASCKVRHDGKDFIPGDIIDMGAI